LLRLLLPHKRWMGVAIFLLLIASCLSNASPLLMMYAVDTYINAPKAEDPAAMSATISGLMQMTFLLAAIVFGEAIIRSVQLMLVTWVGQRTMYEMRMELFRHIQDLPLSFLDRNPVGRLMSRVTSDVDKIQQSIVMGIVQGLSGMLTIVAVLIFMFYVNWQLAFVALLPLPFIFLTSWIFRKFASQSFLEIRRKIATISAYMQETMGGIRLVQILDRQSATSGCGKCAISLSTSRPSNSSAACPPRSSCSTWGCKCWAPARRSPASRPSARWSDTSIGPSGSTFPFVGWPIATTCCSRRWPLPSACLN
jgi:ATP-binding cassette subfamily B protein